MKRFLQWMTEKIENITPNMEVEFDLQKVATYVDPTLLGGSTAGMVVSVTDTNAIVRLENAKEVTIKREDIISLGSDKVA